MRVRGYLAAAAVWAGAVVTVASVASVAIDSAGREVAGAGAARESALSRIPLTSATPADPGRGTATASPSTGPGSAASPGATGTPTVPVASPAGNRATPRATTSPRRPTASPSPRRTRPPTRPPDPPAEVRRTMPTVGGQVTVVCRGPEIVDWSVRPENGWGARERVIERRVLYALFERGNGRVGLRVSCHDGRPGVDRYFVEDGGRNGR